MRAELVENCGENFSKLKHQASSKQLDSWMIGLDVCMYDMYLGDTCTLYDTCKYLPLVTYDTYC